MLGCRQCKEWIYRLNALGHLVMLQLIEKILLDACETHNGNAAIEAFSRLKAKRHEVSSVEEENSFNMMCCYAIHELYYQIAKCMRAKSVEWVLASMLIDILYLVDKGSYLKKYLRIPSGELGERVDQYIGLVEKYARDGKYNPIIPPYVRELVSNAPVTTIVRHQEGRQLVTIKTIVEQEYSMYIDVNVACPKAIKIYMPHLDEPIYASRVLKKYATFAKLFDGKAKENTLSYYYKLNKSEAVLEFIDEDMEAEVAELLGVGLTESQVVDEEAVQEEAAGRLMLTDEQVMDFKKQLEELRASMKNSI